MGVQQVMCLEAVWRALEHAGMSLFTNLAEPYVHSKPLETSPDHLHKKVIDWCGAKLGEYSCHGWMSSFLTPHVPVFFFSDHDCMRIRRAYCVYVYVLCGRMYGYA